MLVRIRQKLSSTTFDSFSDDDLNVIPRNEESKVVHATLILLRRRKKMLLNLTALGLSPWTLL